MSTLYELTNDYKMLLELIIEGEYEEESLADTLEGIEGEIEIKAEGYAKIIKELEADINKFKEEENRLKGRRQSLENSVKKLKENLKNAMEMTENQRIKTDLFSFTIAKNGGKLPLKFTGDAPDNYKKIEYVVDEVKIREELENGNKLEFAELGERGTHLRIR